MAQLTPDARARLEAFKAVVVKHAHLQDVDDQLSLRVEEHADATHVLLCGPGGVGKSKALSVIAERFKDEETDRFVVPILLLEPIPPDQGAYLRLDYYWQIIDALKEHVLVKELVGSVAHIMAAPKPARAKLGAIDWFKIRQVAEQALIRARVRAVFADEGHRLMQGDGSHSVDEQLEWLKSLSNRTKVLYVIYNLERSGRLVNNLHYVYSELVSDVLFRRSRARLYIMHVLAGPYALFGFRNTSGQLARRGRDIHFARYHVDNKEERIAFVAALKSI
jgi:AAA domain